MRAAPAVPQACCKERCCPRAYRFSGEPPAFRAQWLYGLYSAEAGLLRYLGYDDGDAARAEGRAKMLRAAATLRRLFLLPVPDAPGLVFFGGEADPATLGNQAEGLPVTSLAGSGLPPQTTFELCVGEGIENSAICSSRRTFERGPIRRDGASPDGNALVSIAALLAGAGVATRSDGVGAIERIGGRRDCGSRSTTAIAAHHRAGFRAAVSLVPDARPGSRQRMRPCAGCSN